MAKSNYTAIYKNVPGRDEPLTLSLETEHPETLPALAVGTLLRYTGKTLDQVQDVEVEIVGQE